MLATHLSNSKKTLPAYRQTGIGEERFISLFEAGSAINLFIFGDFMIVLCYNSNKV